MIARNPMVQTRPASQKYLREIRPSKPHIARQMFMIDSICLSRRESPQGSATLARRAAAGCAGRHENADLSGGYAGGAGLFPPYAKPPESYRVDGFARWPHGPRRQNWGEGSHDPPRTFDVGARRAGSLADHVRAGRRAGRSAAGACFRCVAQRRSSEVSPAARRLRGGDLRSAGDGGDQVGTEPEDRGLLRRVVGLRRAKAGDRLDQGRRPSLGAEVW